MLSTSRRSAEFAWQRAKESQERKEKKVSSFEYPLSSQFGIIVKTAQRGRMDTVTVIEYHVVIIGLKKFNMTNVVRTPDKLPRSSTDDPEGVERVFLENTG